MQTFKNLLLSNYSTKSLDITYKYSLGMCSDGDMRCAITPAHHRPPEQSLRTAKDRAPHKTMNTIKLKTVARLTPFVHVNKWQNTWPV